MSHDPKKCAHLPCTCTVTEGKFCSDLCKDAAAAAPNTLSCHCTHTGCGGHL